MFVEGVEFVVSVNATVVEVVIVAELTAVLATPVTGRVVGRSRIGFLVEEKRLVLRYDLMRLFSNTIPRN